MNLYLDAKTLERIKERFESKIVKTDKCWTFVGYHGKQGYGSFGVSRGNMHPAHRVAYQLYVGPIDFGLIVCHHCDNPGCVNPKHLYTGYHDNNTADRFLRNRAWTTLNVPLVLKIRALYATTMFKQHELAKMFKVTQSAISRAITGNRWSQWVNVYGQ